MTDIDIKTIVTAAIGLASFILNIIQFIVRRKEMIALRGLVQSDYNIYSNIARHARRSRMEELDDKKRLEEACSALEVIRGSTDAGRTSLISFSREHLNFLPWYEHPTQPGKKQPDEVLFGTPPEIHYSSEKPKDRKTGDPAAQPGAEPNVGQKNPPSAG